MFSVGGLESGGHRALVLGPAGSGKSSLCNAMLCYRAFDVRPYDVFSRSTDDVTRADITLTSTSSYKFSRLGPLAVIQAAMDTPDIHLLKMDGEDKLKEVGKWSSFLRAAPPQHTIIAYTIPANRPFTEEDYRAYTEICKLWAKVETKSFSWCCALPNPKTGSASFTESLVVIFTCDDPSAEDKLKRRDPAESGDPLSKLLADADGVYYIFDETRAATSLPDQLEYIICSKDRANQENRRKRRARWLKLLIVAAIVIALLTFCVIVFMVL